MNVVIITLMNGFPWGGSEELWHDTAKIFAKNGHNVKVSIYDWSVDHPKIKELQNEPFPISIHTRPNRLPQLSLLKKIQKRVFKKEFNSTNERMIWAELELEKSDLIIISQGSTYDLVWHPGLINVLQKLSVPYVIIPQFNFEHYVLNKNEIEIGRSVFAGSKKIYFVAKRNLEIAEMQLACELKNTEIIYNPTNARSFGYLPFPELKDIIHIACVARLDCTYKGQDVLLDVLQNKKWKDKNWHLHLFGEGQDEAYLKLLIEYFKLDNKVTLHGHVNSIKEIWEQCHLLILPSFGEGTPLAMIEAMSCGRPVIATNVGGIGDWVNDETGYLISAPVKEQIGSTLEKAWAEQDKWEGLGKNARKNVMEKLPESPADYFYNKLMSL